MIGLKQKISCATLREVFTSVNLEVFHMPEGIANHITNIPKFPMLFFGFFVKKNFT